MAGREPDQRWSTALVRFALSRDNRGALERHLERWRPLASKLLRNGAELLAAHSGRAPSAIMQSAEHALAELHASAVLAA